MSCRRASARSRSTGITSPTRCSSSCQGRANTVTASRPTRCVPAISSARRRAVTHTRSSIPARKNCATSGSRRSAPSTWSIIRIPARWVSRPASRTPTSRRQLTPPWAASSGRTILMAKTSNANDRKRSRMPLLEVKNLHVSVDGKQILNGLDLTVNKGEVHAIMGPNGSGKSTLAHVLAGKEDYEITAGTIRFDGEDVLAMEPDERAAKGLFLAFQYPLEIPGVATMTFLRTALNAQRKKRGEPELTTPEFMKKVREASKALSIDQEMLRRGVNVGFSGGEKKRNEILQMALHEQRLWVLDETDSGLDIDALRIVSDGVNRLRSPERAMIVITHYQRLLNYIVPDVVHVLSRGRVVKTGDKELALELEAHGYREYQDDAA